MSLKQCMYHDSHLNCTQRASLDNISINRKGSGDYNITKARLIFTLHVMTMLANTWHFENSGPVYNYISIQLSIPVM